VFAAAAQAAKLNGRHLLLVGLGPEAMGVLERSEAALAIGAENLFPTQTRWFAALDAARARALQLVGPGCAPCPLSAAHFDAHAGDVSKTFQRVPTVLKHGDEDRDVNGSV
jgi:hypothetical protein